MGQGRRSLGGVRWAWQRPRAWHLLLAAASLNSNRDAVDMGLCTGRRSAVVEPEPAAAGINTWAAPAPATVETDKQPSSPVPALGLKDVASSSSTEPGSETPSTASPGSDGPPASAPSAEWQVDEMPLAAVAAGLRSQPASASGGLAPLKPLRIQPLGSAAGASNLPPLGGRPPLGAPPAPLPKLADPARGGAAAQPPSALLGPPRVPLQELGSTSSNAAASKATQSASPNDEPVGTASALRPLAALPPPLARGATIGALPTLGALPPPPTALVHNRPPPSTTLPAAAAPPPKAQPVQPASRAQPAPPPPQPKPAEPSPLSQALSPPPPEPLSRSLPLPDPSSLPATKLFGEGEDAGARGDEAAANGDVLAASLPPKPTPKSALARGVADGGAARRERRRLSWNETATMEYYEPCQDRPVDNYKQNLDMLQRIRRERMASAKADCSFAELVSELDASMGGEGLDCLVPRKAEPPPGSWMRGQTWGQLNQQRGGYSSGGAGYSSGGGAGYSSAARPPAASAVS